MVKFINLETGYTFNGDNPYVFWFDEGQSTDLIYTKPIGIYSDSNSLTVSIEENEVFSLVDPSMMNIEENINGFKYYDLNSIKCNTYTSSGSIYNNGYVHVIYILASSNITGEFISTFSINGVDYNIGADFYNENESLYINLSNFGVEIPESIQKTIYSTNLYYS